MNPDLEEPEVQKAKSKPQSKFPRHKKAQSQVRNARPPRPKFNNIQKPSETDIKMDAKLAKQQKSNGPRTSKTSNKYNTDTDSVKNVSKIPRLSSIERSSASKPKKYEPVADYQAKEEVKNEEINSHPLRRSQSYLEKKPRARTDQNSAGINDLRSANKQVQPSSSKNILPPKEVSSRRSVNYKPYTLREYRKKFDEPQTQDTGYKMRGGLGANIGGEEWSKEQAKRERMKQFANRVKSKNKNDIGDRMRSTNQSSATDFNKKSKREIAIEYARGISKPTSQFRQDAIHLDELDDELLEEDENDGGYSYQYNNNQYKHNYSNYKDRIGYDDMQENTGQFASEIDKIKALF